MPRPLRIGIIGIGFGQHVHLPAFRAHRNCKITALCASTLARARPIAAKYGIKMAYGNWRDLVRDPEIDAISVAVPPGLQYPIALAALKLRKPVFCEKPLALTARETSMLYKAASSSRTPAMVDFEFPEIDVWKKAKNLLDAGALGRLRHALVSWQVQTRALQSQTGSWKVRSQDGGGVLYGFACHTFYYLEHFLGPIQSLSARIYDTTHQGKRPERDTVIVLGLLFRDKVPASVMISNHAYGGSGHRVELYGDKGSVQLINEGQDYTKGFVLQQASVGSSRILRQVSRASKERGDGRIGATGQMVDRFVRWIQEGVPARPNISDGHRVQTLLDKAYQSHLRNKWVTT